MAAAPPLYRGHSETQKPRGCGGPGLLTLDGERFCTSHRPHGPSLTPSMWLLRYQLTRKVGVVRNRLACPERPASQGSYLSV